MRPVTTSPHSEGVTVRSIWLQFRLLTGMSEVNVDAYRACVQRTQKRITHRIEYLCQIPHINHTTGLVYFNYLIADGLHMDAIFFAIIAFAHAKQHGVVDCFDRFMRRVEEAAR